MNANATVTLTDAARAARPCVVCLAVTGLVLAAVVASFAYLATDYRALFARESARTMGKFIAEFYPPDVSAPFVVKTAWAAVQTLAVSALGTLLAVLAGPGQV